LHGGRFPVGQQRHDPPSLQIADDCPVATVPAEGPVIDARNDHGLASHHGSSADDPQQGVVADGYHEPLGKACSRSSAERQAQIMDDAFKPRCSARPERNNVLSEPLGENPSATVRHLAGKPSGD